MYVVCVTIWVKAEFTEQFLAASLENARATREEPGNLRFDISRGADDPARFFFYEAYRDEEAFRAHHDTPHYPKWRETVDGWMAQPRQGLRYQGLFPAHEDAWRADT